MPTPLNSSNGVTLDFEDKLWAAADKLRGHMDAAEYKHVVLGLIVLKYISDPFQKRYAELVGEQDECADPKDKDEYAAVGIFWVPKEARWSALIESSAGCLACRCCSKAHPVSAE